MYFFVGMYPNQSENQMQMNIFWDNIKSLYHKEDPITKQLRLAIDKRQDYITDIAIFLKHKYGSEFEDHMKARATHRSEIAKAEAIKAKKEAILQKEADEKKAIRIRNKFTRQESETKMQEAKKKEAKKEEVKKKPKTAQTPKKETKKPRKKNPEEIKEPEPKKKFLNRFTKK